MKCSIDGCEKTAVTRGWCSKHYYRWYKYDDPLFTKYEMHGYSKHHLYKVWKEMRRRCYNKDRKFYKNYGGRGIIMCDEWMNPKIFIKWALPLWKSGLQIDRRNNNGNYCPKNCHFVTSKENNHNRRLLQENNTSGYCGVSKKDKKWRVYISIDGGVKHLGCFDSSVLAALRYDAEAYRLNDGRPMNFL